MIAERGQPHGSGLGIFRYVVERTISWLVELRFARPEVDGDEAAVNLAELVLRMLGLSAQDVHEVARRPLPDLD
ncbi:hypothetical protein SMALB_5667 [Streptomyces malaysiensis]|uniref:TetR family transcriptional regulator n=1 Tax=Streptomyces malaysiensis TaxID=92644 RepID=A0A7X5X6T0_STRMQ|nr:hypothetical protein [Streptomyces malaysiensis]